MRSQKTTILGISLIFSLTASGVTFAGEKKTLDDIPMTVLEDKDAVFALRENIDIAHCPGARPSVDLRTGDCETNEAMDGKVFSRSCQVFQSMPKDKYKLTSITIADNANRQDVVLKNQKGDVYKITCTRAGFDMRVGTNAKAISVASLQYNIGKYFSVSYQPIDLLSDPSAQQTLYNTKIIHTDGEGSQDTTAESKAVNPR